MFLLYAPILFTFKNKKLIYEIDSINKFLEHLTRKSLLTNTIKHNRIFDTKHTYIDFNISLNQKSIIILMIEL